MPRLFRVPRKVALVLAVLAAALAIPASAQAAQAAQAAPRSAGCCARHQRGGVDRLDGRQHLDGVGRHGLVRALLGSGDQRDSGAAGVLLQRAERPQPAEQHLPAVAAASPSRPTRASTRWSRRRRAASSRKTLYDRYGVAGQYWAATNLGCSDMTSLIGNNVAGHGLRRGQVDRPGHDHRVPVGGGRGHPELAEQRRSTS